MKRSSILSSVAPQRQLLTTYRFRDFFSRINYVVGIRCFGKYTDRQTERHLVNAWKIVLIMEIIAQFVFLLNLEKHICGYGEGII